jgi:hypothetical protein
MNYFLTKAFILIFFSILLRFNTEFQFASYLIVAAYSLFGLRQVILSMLLVWIFVMINTSVAGPNTFAHIGRILVLFFAIFSVLIHYPTSPHLKTSKIFLVTLIFSIFLIFHSIFLSVTPLLSISKSAYWIMSFLTIYYAWNGLNSKVFNEFSNNFYYLLVGIFLVNYALINSPLGFIKNVDLFQGFFDHPNAFGIFTSVVCSLAIGRFFSMGKILYFNFFIIVLSLNAVILSGSRTAGLAIVISFLLSFIIIRFFSSKAILKSFPSKIIYSLSILVLILLLALSYTKVFYLDNFFNKGQNTNQTINYNGASFSSSKKTIVDNYIKSRNVLILPMLDNINKQPFTGIGFGVGSSPERINVVKDTVFGILPISSPIEKGILPLAVIEELGFWGFLLFFIWLFTIFRISLVNRKLLLPVFFTLLLINLGENVLFSPGGFGLFVLIMIGWISATPKSQNYLTN